MQIHPESVVTMRYRMGTVEGDFYDEAWDDDALVYIHGHHAIVPGLETVLSGHGPGESMLVVIPPRHAHGEYDQRLEFRMPMSEFPEDIKALIEPGFEFSADHPYEPGERRDFTVKRIDGSEVALSGNHKLAGRTLLVEVQIVEVRDASPDELVDELPARRLGAASADEEDEGEDEDEGRDRERWDAADDQ